MKKILSLVMCFAMALSFVQMSAYAGDAVETPDDEFLGNGNVDTHYHNYENLVNNEDGHWYECECGEKENTQIETHEYTKKYDQESHYLYCDVCEYISGREDHLLNKVNAEKDGHTLACDCGYTTEILDHEYSNDCDATCDVCEEVRAVEPHKYTIIRYDDNNHWYECSRCGEKENTYIETHEYTKKYDQESHYFYCDVCEYISGREDHLLNKVNAGKDGHTLACDCGYTTEILDHEYSNDCDATCDVCEEVRAVVPHKYTIKRYDDNNHWDECVCGEKDDKSVYGHSFSTYFDNEKHYLMCYCEYIKKEEAHKFDIKYDDDYHWTACECRFSTEDEKHDYKAATCTTPKTCKVCGATSGKALGHDYKAATCTAPKTCKVCKATSGKALGHKYTKVTTKAATTSKDGYILTECSVCGADKSKTTIYYPKTVKLSYETCTYTGKTRTPGIVVKDSKGKTISSKYYTVTPPKTRKYVGKYKYTIKFKGNYSGTKTLYLTINPKAASINKLTAKNKAIAVKLNRSLKQSTGYQIQYSTSKKFTSAKTKTLKSYKTSTVTLSGLKAKKTYYVRVRTYKTVDGKKYYSNWSSYKYKKTK